MYKMRLMTTFMVGTNTGVKMQSNGVISPNVSTMPGVVVVETESFSEPTCLGLDQMVAMCIKEVNKNGGPVCDLAVKLFNAVERLIPDKYFYVNIGPYLVEKDTEGNGHANKGEGEVK